MKILLRLSSVLIVQVVLVTVGFQFVSSMHFVAEPIAAAEESAQEQTQESRFLSNVRQLTFEGRRSGEGYFSSDESHFVFQSERESGNPFFQIYLMDLQTGTTHRISPGHGKTTCAWLHPDGLGVLFASTHADPDALLKQRQELESRASGQTRRYSWDFDEYFDIYESDRQGSNLKNLTHVKGYDAEGSWSPDGQRIVFSSNRHAYAGTLSFRDQAIFERDKSYFVDLYLMNSDGTNVSRLTDEEGYDGGPFFSPDGKMICWRKFSKDGATAEIYTMDLHRHAVKRITNLKAMSWAPYFHPSGDYLIFTTNLHGFGNFELYLVDVSGKSEPVRVTHSEGFDGLPTFAPSGKMVAWTSNRTANGQSQLFLADWNDQEARRLLGLDLKTEKAGSFEREGPTSIADLSSTTAEVQAQDLRLHVSRLSSDRMEGRLTGTRGAQRATEYVASAFEALGLEAAGDNGTYFQNFEFTAGVSLGSENRFTVLKENLDQRNFPVDEKWRPLAFSRIGNVGPAGVVFAGYGIVAPAADEHQEYDSYAHLRVSGKWVMVLRHLPEDISPELRQHLARYASLRHKAMVARERGALGLMVVSGPNSQVEQELVPLSFDASQAGSGITTLSITDELAQEFLIGSERNLQGLQTLLDQGESVMGFEIADLQLEAEIDIQQQKRTGRNVLARVSAGEGVDETVVVGAHLDHLGRGLGGSSLARGEETGMIHHGADDNASGVGGVIEIAQHLSDQIAQGRLDPKRHLLVAAWSGEELGLLGSTHFVKTVSGRKSSGAEIVAYLNMDMIGRLEKSVVLQGVGSSSVWAREIEQHNVPVGLPIVVQDDSYLPTDATSFYLQRIPILSAFTGVHEDYHTPRDTSEKINYKGSEQIVRFMTLMTRSLLTRESRPDYVEMQRPENTGTRASLRAYLGTIPDYSQSEVVGVKLSGVIKGGPADQAGVRKGDVITELAGRKIENIYDYTYAIDALKVGTQVKMVVMRAGQMVNLNLTPVSRE